MYSFYMKVFLNNLFYFFLVLLNCHYSCKECSYDQEYGLCTACHSKGFFESIGRLKNWGLRKYDSYTKTCVCSEGFIDVGSIDCLNE
jgi:hypothetical protein